MSPEHRKYLLEQLDALAIRRDWAQLPDSFEHDAVKMFYSTHRTMFRGTIKPRIMASKAQTIDDLYLALTWGEP